MRKGFLIQINRHNRIFFKQITMVYTMFSRLVIKDKKLHIISLIMLIQSLSSGIFAAVSIYLLTVVEGSNEINDPLNMVLNNGLFNTGFVMLLSQCFVLVCPYIGMMSDRMGRKKCFIFIVISAAVGYMLLATALYANTLIILMIGLGFISISSADFPLLLAMIADSSVGFRRMKYFSVIFVMALGITITTRAASLFLTSHHDLKMNIEILLMITITLELINLYIAKYVLSETLNKSLNSDVVYTDTIIDEFFQIFSRPQIKFYFFIFFLINLTWGIYYQYIPIYLENALHWNELSIRYFLNIDLLLMILGALVFLPIIIRYLGMRKTIAMSLILFALANLIWLFIRTSNAQYFILFLHAFSVALLVPILWSVLFYQTSSQQRGFLASLIAILWAVSWMFGNAIIAFLFSYQIDFPVILTSLLSLILLLCFKKFFNRKI